VESMGTGEKATVKIAPKYGYGKEGNNLFSVSGDSYLEYDIELVDFVKEKGS